MRKEYILGTLLSLFICLIVFIYYINNTGSNTLTNKDFGEIYILENSVSVDQWYLLNNGKFSKFVNDYSCWEGDEKISVSGVDININNIDNVYVQNRYAQIAILDSDIDLTNAALNNKVWINKDEIPDDNIDNDGNGYIDDINGWNFCNNNNELFNKKDAGIHGTHTTGILFGNNTINNFYGILSNYNVSYMYMKVLQGENETGKIEYIIDAIEYAEENGAQICCMSFATYTYSEELKNTMKASDMLFVVASGNYGKNIDNGLSIYPACFDLDNILTVADIRCDGKLSCISNYGEKSVDIAAPGTDIVSTIPNSKYTYLSGTSCATAMVVGEAALIYCCSPSLLSSKQIKGIIIQASTYSSMLKHRVFCSGYINVYDALKECLRYK